MNGAVPDPWEFVILAAAAWRIWHLLAVDAILDPVRDRIFRYGDRHEKALTFLECPYCAGFWITALWWAVWTQTDWALVVAAPFALHAGMLTVERILDRGE